MDVTDRAFVTGLNPVVGDFATAYQPIIQVFREGMDFQIQATLLEDHSCRLDHCVADFSRINDAKLVTISGEEPDSAKIQVPNVRSYRISLPEIVIPEGMSLVVAIPGISQSSDLDPMFLMITPRWIEVDPVTREFAINERKK
jgi:hypothetical protein